MRNGSEVSPEEPMPNQHETGDNFAGGTWNGRAMTEAQGTTAETITYPPMKLVGNYRVATFTSPAFYVEQTVSPGTWTIALRGYENHLNAFAYIRYSIYKWNSNDTKGTEIVAPTTHNVVLNVGSPATCTISASGGAVTLDIGDKVVLDIAINATSEGERAFFLSWGNSTENSYLTAIMDLSLPVELTSFTATAGDGVVTLRWTTESEIENLGFNIYRSTNYNVKFLMINDGLISGAGNSSTRHEYEYVDNGLTNGVTYWYKLEDVDYSGNTELHGPVSATSIESAFPAEFRLYPNYPNPFNPVTTISYDLPDDGLVELTVYNMRGEKVTTLMQGKQAAGSYKLNWDGTDRNGGIVSSGIYILRIMSGSYSRTSKMVFIR